MPTTSNFGWTTPADTDLVKDGALAIRTLGNGIDTSLVDLKGGTTGQVLSKTSNTDMDFTWVTTDDADAIQNAIVDAKGDLIAASAADTPARLAAGADYTVLQALASAGSVGLQYAGDLVSYTPTWTASTTNPSIGNGTLVGKYLRIGKMCYVRIRLQLGSTTTTGSGNWRFALPFTAQTNSLNDGAPAGGYAEDNGVAGYRLVACAIGSAGTYVEPQNGTGNSSYSPTVPFTWGNTDYLQFAIVYEVA